jgi:hypothetical protein
LDGATQEDEAAALLRREEERAALSTQTDEQLEAHIRKREREHRREDNFLEPWGKDVEKLRTEGLLYDWQQTSSDLAAYVRSFNRSENDWSNRKNHRAFLQPNSPERKNAENRQPSIVDLCGGIGSGLTVFRQLGIELGRIVVVEAPAPLSSSSSIDPMSICLDKHAAEDPKCGLGRLVGLRVKMGLRGEGTITDVRELQRANFSDYFAVHVEFDDGVVEDVDVKQLCPHGFEGRPEPTTGPRVLKFIKRHPLPAYEDTRPWAMQGEAFGPRSWTKCGDALDSGSASDDVEWAQRCDAMLCDASVLEVGRRVKYFPEQALIVFRDVCKLADLLRFVQEKMNNGQQKDILQLLFGKDGPDVIIASPPCQNVSTVNPTTTRLSTLPPVVTATIDVITILREICAQRHVFDRKPQFIFEETKTTVWMTGELHGRLGVAGVEIPMSCISPVAGKRVYYISFPPPTNPSAFALHPKGASPFYLLDISVDDAVKRLVKRHKKKTNGKFVDHAEDDSTEIARLRCCRDGELSNGVGSCFSYSEQLSVRAPVTALFASLSSRIAPSPPPPPPHTVPYAAPLSPRHARLRSFTAGR